MFQLDPAFLSGSVALPDLPLCAARLQNDARYPWIVLIPRVEMAREIEDLSVVDRGRLMEECVLAGRAVRAMGEALGRRVKKLNLGALGNITPQLHVHLVGRRMDDAAWPGPVWGFGEATAYDREALEIARLVAIEVLAGGQI